MDLHAPDYHHLSPPTLYRLLAAHRHNLGVMGLQAAAFGSLYVPAYLLLQIDTTRTSLTALEAELTRRGLDPATVPQDIPLARRMAVMAPRLPNGFVERPTELDQILASILDPTRTEPVAITTALQGAGGFGKTTLAAALCHDPSAMTPP
jgi:hypothetical protein